MKKQNLFFILLLFLGNMILYAQCSVNAGGNATICGTSYTLQGSSSGSTSGTPTWTLVSKPSGAPDPVISNVNSLTPNVTGMTSPGNYVFQLAQNCSPSGTATSQVTVTAPGATTGFTAGADITNISAITGTATLNATIPAGYTPSWTYYNLNSFEFNSSVVTTNATMSNTNTATPTLTLTKKSDHDIDPVYRVILRITSINNPSCWYEDDAIVRFIPNPNVIFPNTTNFCGNQTTVLTNRYYYDTNSNSPKFSDNTANASANPLFGTTITMNVISQPSGGNLTYDRMANGRIYFGSGFNQTVGSYVFTLTVSNAIGTYTTQQLTFNYNGPEPQALSFVDAAYPEQMSLYSPGSSAGAVYCNRAGTTTPITINFKINPLDSPTLNATVTTSTIIPAGGAPGIIVSGDGTMNRTATLTPPLGGWQVGTYSFRVAVSNGTCTRTHNYYVHISDGNRPNVEVNNMTVCYPGSGVVSATVPLPAIYKGVVTPSYFQDYSGRYELTVVTKPAGSATPTFDPTTLRTFTNTSTVINNLNMQGEYVFKITATPPPGGDPGFIQKEYACSGTSYEDTFSVFVSAQVGANAGSSQTLIGTSQTTFNANNPGVATGAWTLLTKPSGATDPVIATPSVYNTNVTGFNTPGIYTFRWTVTTGTCSSTSDLTVNVLTAAPGGVDGAQFWVKSDDAGTIATAWKDHSINANDIPAVGTWALSAADRSHNFNPYTTGYTTSKYFYNTTSLMNATNGELPNTNTSIFSAVRPTTANGTGRITGIDDDAGNAAEPGMSIAAGNPRQYEWFNTTTSTDFSTAFNTGVSNIFSAIANNAVANGGTSASAGGEKILGLNGTYETTPFTGTNKFQIYGRNLRVGHGTWDAAGPFPGDIMEVVWYKRTLTANEQSRVNSYLAIKNGVTLNENYLATDSNVVWDRTVNTGYNNNIFGIAKDNLTVLHQKQSGSVNNGQKLVISTTGFADNNIANTTGLANDLQFLMAGDNGLKQSLTTPLVYTAGSNGTVNYRFESIWKAQNSGGVGTVTVAWPKGLKNLYLVQSPDAVFDATDTFTPMVTEVTVNGVVYNTANVTLGNGQFFTFAGFAQAPGGVAAGLSYWYRADKNAINTGAATDVTAWTDVWNGTTVAQMGTNVLPKYALGASDYFNFNPGINFTATTQSLGNIAVQTLTSLNYDIFTLTKEGMNGTRFFNIGRNNTAFSGDNWDSPAFEPGGSVVRRNNAGGGPVYWANPGNTFVAGIPSIAYTTFTDINLKRGVNGSSLLGPASNHSAIGAVTGGHIFGRNSGTLTGGDDAGFTGHIGETIIYGSGILTPAERRKVDSYLAIKYGITLGQVATDHYLDTAGNIVWNGGTNSTYNNNIFGVSRDDIEIFEQKVSKSVNTGTILTVATTNDFVNPNQDAARTGFANDKTYFLLGDNNNVITTLSSMTINGFTGGSRIPRIWLSQRANTSGTMYFGADLSSYGGGFGSGDHVKMIIADDAAFTTNVVYVNGTYDATAGKWVHSHNFDSENANRYITYATVDEVACTTGCNDNTYLTATDPNTIEYDNIIADETTTIVKQKDGSFYVWGPNASPNVSSANTNVVLNLLTPTKIDPTTTLPTTGSTGNGFSYAGMPLKAALANVYHLLTTDGLYVWGGGNMYTLNTIGNTAITYRTPNGYRFGKLTVNNKADGLPPGVSPTNVKMMSGNQETLALVTCSGAAWVFSQSSIGSVYGDNATGSVANNSIWHRVMISATQTLDNVVAMRGIRSTKFALTSNGKLYTWGLNTFHNDNTAGVTSNYATEISVPAGVTPKMIGMTEGNNEGQGSYYLLATDGRLFAMGYNAQRQLGLGDTTVRLNWTEVTATSGSNTLGGNIAWISPADNVNNLPSINVLTTAGKQWGWGRSSQGHLGVVNNTGIDPIYMPGNGTGANGLNLNGKVTAIKDGGQHAINFKENSTNYGFIGLNTYGSKGDGSSVVGTQDLLYSYVSVLDICGTTVVSGACYKPGVLTGIALDTKAGITALNRAGTGSDNWPMVRKGGWLALESKTKAFVPNRVTFSGGNPVGIAPANFVEGMMVYDTTNKCMKMYTLKEGDASMAWHCISTQACPD